jgi:PadR family transcriptional regulator PadR
VAVHLGEFEQLVLFALVRLGEGGYGIAVRHEIERRTGREVSQGAVYMALNRLADRGFVSSRVADTTPTRGGRRRKYYTLEAAGAQTLQRAYSQVHAMARGVLPRLAELADGPTPKSSS